VIEKRRHGNAVVELGRDDGAPWAVLSCDYCAAHVSVHRMEGDPLSGEELGAGACDLAVEEGWVIAEWCQWCGRCEHEDTKA
jgi:hypothetical protein